jgi:ubiquinone/menaquinone biosynthesis C-methylase UbiE
LPGDIWAKWLDKSARENEAFDRQLRLLRSQVRDRVLHKAGLRRGSRVVDLGCGRGFLSLEAARLVGPEGRVIAVDQSPGALEALQEEAAEKGMENLVVVEADIAALPLDRDEADAVVARSVLSYVPDRSSVLKEARRILKEGGALSLFEPVLSEEELVMNWGREASIWVKLHAILLQFHPAYSFKRGVLLQEVEAAGFDEVESFTWHADVSRPLSGEREAMEDLRGGLPGEFSLLECWLAHGAGTEEIGRVARRLAEESNKPSYRDILPCLYIWAKKPERE